MSEFKNMTNVMSLIKTYIYTLNDFDALSIEIFVYSLFVVTRSHDDIMY
jgi:hypothetical protein